MIRDLLISSDADSVHALVDSCGVFSAEEIEVAREMVVETQGQGVEKTGYHYLFMEQEGHVAGFACYGRIPLTESSFDLYWLVVGKSYQRRGIARLLLEAAESRVISEGGLQIYVETSSTSLYQPARSFYQDCGYRIISVYEDFYRKGDDKVTLVKRLPVS